MYNCRILFEMTVWIVNPFDNLPVEGYRPQRYWLMARAFARAGHAGTGPKEMALRRRAADCPRIRFRGYLEKDATASIFRRAHAGVIPMFPDSCVGVPNKLADYAAAGLRVVNSLPGETAQILDKFGAGVSYEAGNMVSFIRAVRKLRQLDHAVPDGFRLLFDAERLYGGFVDFIEKKVSVK